jgi:bifunctional isochorismate lyase/aryl carrier protein
MKDSFQLKRDKCALLVIDMQKYFVNKESSAYVPSTDALVLQIKKLIDVFNKNSRPIIFTRHIDTNNSMMRRWWQENIEIDDPMSEITSDFDTNRGMVLVKHQYDAFFDTKLENYLQKKHIEQVVICGVLTNLCCETTARSAFMRGFEVYFVTDGTATYKQKMHDASVLNLSYGFAVPVTVDAVIKLLS